MSGAPQGEAMEAIARWVVARRLRCYCCDEGFESAPCTCIENVGMLVAAEERLTELAIEAGKVGQRVSECPKAEGQG